MKYINPLHPVLIFLVLTLPARAVVTAPVTSEARENQTSKTSSVVSTVPEGIRVFPNPWRADQDGNTTITFDHLPPSASIKIFTVSGHEIRTLSADGGGNAAWDRTNNAGDKVASGIYLYLITDSQGNKTNGKLAIIR